VAEHCSNRQVERRREVKRKGQWVSETETAWLITSLTATAASPHALLIYNRDHWRIENNLHRNKDVTLGEDAYTSRQGDSNLGAEPIDGEGFVVLAAFDGDLRR
jgi:predicted transposase YbfD/YdcC